MTTEFVDTVKEGYVRLKSRKLGVWQKRWIVFKKASSAGPKRLEKFMDERCANHRGYHKIIILDHVIRVARLPSNVKKHGVIITFSDNSCRQFVCDSDVEADSWCKTFAMEVCPENCGILAGEPDILLSGLQREKNERFHVFLQPSSHLSVSGECTLQVTEDSVNLWDVINPKLKLVTWPLYSLRRYGKDNQRFLLESSRNCHTGEGLFTFVTTHGHEIYQRVHRLSMALAISHQKNGSLKDIHSNVSSEKSVMPDFLDENVRQAEAVEQTMDMTQSSRRHSSSFHIPLTHSTELFSKQIAKDSTEQAAEQSTGQAAKQSTEQAAKQSTEQATEQATEQVIVFEQAQKSSSNISNAETMYENTEINISDSILWLDTLVTNPSLSQDVWIPRKLCNNVESQSLATASRTQSAL
ncbi:docking protein 5-like isoform X2 [Antedon mediterranea]|uniref:docking protein 5-like isoform X2 n=1 Tax=Antedon mediterranea TaxID=105859 RepID=UPI003AF9931F